MLVPVIVAIVSVPLFGYVKKVVVFIDALHPNIQRLLVVVQVWALALLSQLAGVALPDNLAGFELSTVESVVAAALAFLLHAVRKKP